MSSEVRRGAPDLVTPVGPGTGGLGLGRRGLAFFLGRKTDDTGLHVSPELLQGSLLILLHLGDSGQVLTRDATGVEGSHRQLRAGLADGLRGDDTGRFPHFHEPGGREVATVAGRADALRHLAGQRRTHLHFAPRQPALVPQLLGQLAQLGGRGVGDFVALLRQHLAGEGIGEIHRGRLSDLEVLHHALERIALFHDALDRGQRGHDVAGAELLAAIPRRP